MKFPSHERIEKKNGAQTNVIGEKHQNHKTKAAGERERESEGRKKLHALKMAPIFVRYQLKAIIGSTSSYIEMP